MMECLTCSKIKAIEYQLDVRAKELAQRVITLCQLVVARNNKRWKQFAKLCCLPLVGNLIKSIIVMPRGLEREPEYYNEEWYKTLGRQIEIEAYQLESMKGAHLEHWGDEIVAPMDDSDPGGYYTPSKSPRRDCYDHGFTAFVPNKFDFSSAAGVDKYNEGKLVMCSITKRLVKMNDCDWQSDSKGVRYHLRNYSPRDLISPSFNEWRNNVQAFEAQEKLRKQRWDII